MTHTDKLMACFADEVLSMGFTNDNISTMIDVAGNMIYIRYESNEDFSLKFWNSVHDKLIKEYPFLTRNNTERIIEFILVLIINMVKPKAQKFFLVVAKRYKIILQSQTANKEVT